MQQNLINKKDLDSDMICELGKYMKSRGIEKDEAIGVVLLCKTKNQRKAIFDWMKANENLDNIIEKCLEIRETIK